MAKPSARTRETGIPYRRTQLALLLAGLLAVFVAITILKFRTRPDPISPVLGPIGLCLLVLSALTPVARSFAAGAAVAFPQTVGRRRLYPDRALRARMAMTLVAAIGIPVAAAITVMALVADGWFWITFGLMLGGAGLAVGGSGRRGRTSTADASGVTGTVERLCMVVDMPVPEVVTQPQPVPTAWIAAGRIHLSESLLDSLDGSELEAVLAHELAHLAHRDAAVMEVATAPSRLFLGVVAVCLHPGRLPNASLAAKAGLLMFGVIYVAPAFVLGWVSRLFGLGLSRAREFAADAAAATLTGRPSALASALLKLEGSQAGVPRRDLREVEARSALCIVEANPSRPGRLLHTHPPLQERIARLEAMERRLSKS